MRKATIKQPVKHISRRKDPLARHFSWMYLAMSMAEQPVGQGGSPHPKVKVGAVLVDAKGNEIARASNDFAAGVDRRRSERKKDNQKSLWINCAEQLAIARAAQRGVKLAGAKIYVSLEPCAVCAGLIAEAGIKHVFVPVNSLRRYVRLKPKWRRSIEVGQTKLAEAGVTVTAVDCELKKGMV